LRYLAIDIEVILPRCSLRSWWEPHTHP